MRPVIFAALVAAVPASAQQEAFDITLHCHNELPMRIDILALQRGMISLSLPDMIAACVEAMPTKSKWRTGA